MLAQLDIAPWAEYGLAGLVIAALLWIVWVVLKRQVDHMDKQADRHDQRERDKDAAHRSEREEWRKDAAAREERLDRTLNSLAEAMRERRHE